MAIFPWVHLDNHLIIHLRDACHLIGRRRHINVVYQRRLIGHHVIEIFRALQRPDDGPVRPHQNLDHAPFSICAIPTPSAIREDAITADPRHHTILVHRRALVLGRDIKISEAVAGFIKEIAEAVRIDLQHADHQIRLLRHDVAIFPDPGDLPGGLQIIQEAPEP